MSALSTALKVHIALNVRDVGSSTAFYQKLFGIEPLKARPGYAKFDVQFPPVNLSLNQSMPTGSGTLSHLGIQVSSTEDVLAVRKQWQGSGLMPRDEMQTICCFALQDKAWVRDPDGNEWEVFVVLQDNLPGGGSCCSETPLVTIEQ
jgi:catechol 2,3-dioxygenase-like lactoylglutathione lyase family enzyme